MNFHQIEYVKIVGSTQAEARVVCFYVEMRNFINTPPHTYTHAHVDARKHLIRHCFRSSTFRHPILLPFPQIETLYLFEDTKMCELTASFRSVLFILCAVDHQRQSKHSEEFSKAIVFISVL